MENNDDNNNEELDFDSVQTLAEMKKERFDKTGGDPMHELNEKVTNISSNGSKNADYNDLTNLHRSKIKNNVQYNEYDMDNTQKTNNGGNSTKKDIWTLIFGIICIAIIAGIVRFVIFYKLIENQNGVILKRNENLFQNSTREQTEKEEEMYKQADDLFSGYYSSANDTIEDADLSDIEVKQYNAEWEAYNNENNVRGSNIKMLLKNVKSHNESNEDMQIGVNINASNSEGTNFTGVATSSEDIEFIISDLIDVKNNNYSVKCKYDKKGYVNEIEIVEN